MNKKPKNHNYSRKPNPKFSGKGKEEIVKKEVDNDPAWYTSNGQLLKDVSSFSFNNALGAPIKIKGFGINGGIQYESRLPGILSIFTTPAIGVSDSSSAPVNVAMRNIYSYVRHANSGHANYDPADLMIYLLAMDSVYTYWAYLTRVYGVAQLFSKTNRYVGDALMRAMGVDPSSFRANLADMRAYINMFATKASALAVPKTMSYFVRHSWMYSNIYKDEDTSKAQMYLYDPAFLYTYGIESATGAGKLFAIPIAAAVDSDNTIIGTTMRTVGELQFTGETMLNNLLSQEDIGIMSGDILKAYGAENLWKLDMVPENYVVMPTFSEEVLAQIHNTDFAGKYPKMMNGDSYVTNYHALDIEQYTDVGGGNLRFQPIFGTASHLWHDRILDFWKEDPSPEDIVVATRNMLTAIPLGTNKNVRLAQVTGAGSEIPMYAVMWVFDVNNQLSPQGFYENDNNMNVMPMASLSKFNEYPRYYQCKISGDDVGTINNVMGEMDTYTVLSSYEVENLHLMALLSMFGVPYVK